MTIDFWEALDQSYWIHNSVQVWHISNGQFPDKIILKVTVLINTSIFSKCKYNWTCFFGHGVCTCLQFGITAVYTKSCDEIIQALSLLSFTGVKGHTTIYTREGEGLEIEASQNF